MMAMCTYCATPQLTEVSMMQDDSTRTVVISYTIDAQAKLTAWAVNCPPDWMVADLRADSKTNFLPSCTLRRNMLEEASSSALG